jgi:hypothetical protein
LKSWELGIYPPFTNVRPFPEPASYIQYLGLEKDIAEAEAKEEARIKEEEK